MCDLYVDHNLMFVPCVCFGLLELTRFRADFLALGRIIQGVFLPIFLHDDVKDVVQKFAFLAQSRFALGQFRLGSISVRQCAIARRQLHSAGMTHDSHEHRCSLCAVAG